MPNSAFHLNDTDPLSRIQPYATPDADCTCNLCWAEFWLASDDERAMALRSTRRFVAVVSSNRPHDEFWRLYEERERRIREGEHPGDLVCTCVRCGREFTPLGERPMRFCPPCRDQNWDYDEDWSRTRAFEDETMPRSEHAPGLRLGEEPADE